MGQNITNQIELLQIEATVVITNWGGYYKTGQIFNIGRYYKSGQLFVNRADRGSYYKTGQIFNIRAAIKSRDNCLWVVAQRMPYVCVFVDRSFVDCVYYFQDHYMNNTGEAEMLRDHENTEK